MNSIFLWNILGQDKDGPGYTEFSKRVKQELDIIVAVTGGFRSRMHVENALKDGLCDIVGMGRPLILTPGLPKKMNDLEEFPDQRFPKPSFIVNYMSFPLTYSN